MSDVHERIASLSIQLLEQKQELNNCNNSLSVGKAAYRDGTWDGAGRWETFQEWEVAARHAGMMIQRQVDETKIQLAKAKSEWRSSKDYGTDVVSVLKKAREAIIACEELIAKLDLR